MTEQISDLLISSTRFLATPYELSFDSNPPVEFATNNWPLAFGLVTSYVIFIFGAKYVMKDREPFDLRIPLAMWNALLSIFSFIGMFRTMPYLLGMIMKMPYEQTICGDPAKEWAHGTTGFWVCMFIFSKIPELVDTVFIVLRKKPLIFLHWYHHVTVLLFCWSAYSTRASSGLYFVAMNYTVHALMYGYYCLQALNVCPKSFPAYLITLSQIAQMFIGTFVCCSAWYYALNGRTCHNDRSNLIAGGLMYASYLYLFCDFAVRRYVFKKPRGKKGSKTGEAVTTETAKKLE